MELWNKKDLPQPPVNTYKSVREEIDLLKFRNALQEVIRHFKNEEFLVKETAILSRILYRMKTKFRSAKDFKYLEKLSHSLDIYFKTGLTRYLKNMLDMIPAKYEQDTYLPTKSMLHYVLVRFQGLAKLMERTYDTCLIVASELYPRFYIGHFWKLFLILFAVVSRISVLVKYNTKFLCELYGKLLPYSLKLRNTGMTWLPEAYNLPSDLRTWLGVEWVYEEEFVDLTFEPANNEIVNFFNLVDDDDDDDDVLFCNEYILLDDEEKQIVNDFKKLSRVKKSVSSITRMRGFSINEDDIGEEITDVTELIAVTELKHNPNPNHILQEEKESDVEEVGEEISDTPNNNDEIPHADTEIVVVDDTMSISNESVVIAQDCRKNGICSKEKNQKKSGKLRKRGCKKNDCSLDMPHPDSEVVVLDDTISVSNESIVITQNCRKEIVSSKKKSRKKSAKLSVGCGEKNGVISGKGKIMMPHPDSEVIGLDDTISISNESIVITQDCRKKVVSSKKKSRKKNAKLSVGCGEEPGVISGKGKMKMPHPDSEVIVLDDTIRVSNESIVITQDCTKKVASSKKNSQMKNAKLSVGCGGKIKRKLCFEEVSPSKKQKCTEDVSVPSVKKKKKLKIKNKWPGIDPEAIRAENEWSDTEERASNKSVIVSKHSKNRKKRNSKSPKNSKSVKKKKLIGNIGNSLKENINMTVPGSKSELTSRNKRRKTKPFAKPKSVNTIKLIGNIDNTLMENINVAVPGSGNELTPKKKRRKPKRLKAKNGTSKKKKFGNKKRSQKQKKIHL